MRNNRLQQFENVPGKTKNSEEGRGLVKKNANYQPSLCVASQNSDNRKYQTQENRAGQNICVSYQSTSIIIDFFLFALNI